MTKPAPLTRLLVVHPDADARTFLRRRFTRLGHEVMEAAEHAKALSLIAVIPFDLVLLDLETSGPEGATGLDLLRRMRNRRSAAQLPIIAIADESAVEDAAEALAQGADDCLFRPLYIDVAHARAEMLIQRRGAAPAPHASRGELQAKLEALQEAAGRTEAVTAVVEEMGRDVRASLNGLLGAASVLTQICGAPEFKSAIETIDSATVALDLLVVRALGRADRRIRAPKAKLNVLVADDDAGSRLALRRLLDAAEVQVELTEVFAGLEAARATDRMFFDLIVINLATPEAIAGIRAVRRAERENRMRRTPVLALGMATQSTLQAVDAGADLVMRDPVTAERLLSTLAEALATESEDVRAVA